MPREKKTKWSKARRAKFNHTIALKKTVAVVHPPRFSDYTINITESQRKLLMRLVVDVHALETWETDEQKHEDQNPRSCIVETPPSGGVGQR